MVSKIIWTKRAQTKFKTIIKYLETEWGEKVTSSFVKRTFDLIDIIADHPELGTIEHKEKKYQRVSNNQA